MAGQWIRTVNTVPDWTTGTWLIASIPASLTISRIRFSWGFFITSPAVSDMTNFAFNAMAWGLVTTIGNGTETVPNPRLNPQDAAPPTQRWLWWEVRTPTVAAISEGAGVIAWRDSGPQEPTDAKGQVLATGIPGGDTLNLWASWAAAYGPDDDSDTMVWGAASVLIL
jgi:hypothetical protein